MIDITTSILSQNTICFETRNLDTALIPVTLNDAKFGILNINAVTATETNSELEFLFVVDCSGSMSDMCSDGRSKMQHIIHTLKNMIRFFAENPKVNVFVTVNAFDDQIYHIIPRTKIDDNNLSEIEHKIEKIVPRNSTDIEFALKESAKNINELIQNNPNNIISHIFMTDGEATSGSSDLNVLKNLVISNVYNAFIGFGIDHDSALLNEISSVGKSGYYFIDKLESAGLVYGEILHGIVYKLLTNAKVIIENGLIYNFKTNEWTNCLEIGDIVSEANKTYNIASNDIENCKVKIQATMNDIVIDFPSNLLESVNLTQHLFRQRTLQLLYEINEYNKKKRLPNLNNTGLFRFIRNFPQEVNNEETSQNETNLIEKIETLFKEMKAYMTENGLENDKFMKNLCDDIFICHRTFGTRFSNMYCTARQTSQGTQRCYTVSHTQNIDEPTFQMPRATNYIMNNNNTVYESDSDNDVDYEFDAAPSFRSAPAFRSAPFGIFANTNFEPLEHVVSNFDDAPYLTPQATNVMRYVSAPMNFVSDDEDINNLTDKIN